MTSREAFGQVLKKLRAQHKLSQNKLSKMSGLSRTYIGRLENGEQSPTIETIEMLGKVFNMSGSKILAKAEKLY